MKMLVCVRHSALAAACVIGALCGQARAANLIKDGGFETPPTPMGAYIAYEPGQTIGKWLVTGSGNVATGNSYNEGGVLWVAHHGKAFMDLTGTCDCGADSGVSQTFKTQPGTTYKLTFWVGNTVIEGQGSTSTIDVTLDSKKLLRATNKLGKGSPKEVWMKFSTTFVAKTSATILNFANGDPSGDEQNGLDDVSVVAE